MKVGILTYHRSHNYGALLQAIATRVILEQLGHEAYYIDYWPAYHRRMYTFINWRNVCSLHIKSAYDYLVKNVVRVAKNKRIRIKNMEGFIREHIRPYCRSTKEIYDTVLYGSDQIWRKQPGMATYNPFYFGCNGFHCKKHVSFSASVGILPQDAPDVDRFKTLVSHLDKVAVRELELKDFLEGLGFQNVSLTLDPTLLLSSAQWDNVLGINGERQKEDDYILFYNLTTNSFDINNVREFAERHHCGLKILHGIPVRKETDEDICTVSPKDFVALVRNARYVFTSSFHGLVFSILYKKQFWASFSKNAGRAESILGQLGISERLLAPMAQIPPRCLPIDYAGVSRKLDVLKEKSMAFLMRL